MEPAYYIISLIAAAFLGLIPATIAKNKGYSFGLWWFYGWMLFIVAIIHVAIIPDKNAQTLNTSQPPATQSVADELLKFKELLDAGVITEDEFNAKKEQLMKLL